MTRLKIFILRWFWRGCLPYCMPTRLHYALANWLFEIPPESRLDWRKQSRGCARQLVIELWADWWARLLPWRLRCAVWNWMWNRAPDLRINWRTRRRFADN